MSSSYSKRYLLLRYRSAVAAAATATLHCDASRWVAFGEEAGKGTAKIKFQTKHCQSNLPPTTRPIRVVNFDRYTIVRQNKSSLEIKPEIDRISKSIDNSTRSTRFTGRSFHFFVDWYLATCTADTLCVVKHVLYVPYSKDRLDQATFQVS